MPELSRFHGIMFACFGNRMRPTIGRISMRFTKARKFRLHLIQLKFSQADCHASNSDSLKHGRNCITTS
jgi:hypothetical protein